MKSFAISSLHAGLVQCATYFGYFVMPMPAASHASVKVQSRIRDWAFVELFRYPHFLLAVVAQFMYVGAQVGGWSFFIQYVRVTHEPEKIAGYFLVGTLATFGVGRFSSAYLMRFIAPHKLPRLYGTANVALLGFGPLDPGADYGRFFRRVSLCP